jgi:hypothetical protein
MPVKEVVLCHVSLGVILQVPVKYFSTTGNGSAAVLGYLMLQQRRGFSVSGMNL